MCGWRGAPPPFYPSAHFTALDRTQRSEVLPRLYLTNFRGAEDIDELKKMGVTHVASIGEEFIDDDKGKGIKYWRQNISDDESQGDAMAAALRDAAAFIHKALGPVKKKRPKKGGVIVHCAAGISRSATVVLGYMVLHRKMTLYEAFETAFKARPCIWPNDAFMAALIALEKQVHRKATIELDEYIHWGDYDGPAEAKPSSRPPLARLKRADTHKDFELRELQVLQALTVGETKAAVKLQRNVRQWMAVRHLAGLGLASPRAGGGEGAGVGATPSSTRGLETRRSEALEASAEARASKRSSMTTAGDGTPRPPLLLRASTRGSKAVGNFFRGFMRASVRLVARANSSRRLSAVRVAPSRSSASAPAPAPAPSNKDATKKEKMIMKPALPVKARRNSRDSTRASAADPRASAADPRDATAS